MATIYTYHIYDSADLILTTIKTQEPIPHLEVGHELILANDVMVEYSLVVRRIRVSVTYTRSGPSRCEIHVFCENDGRP